MSEENEDVLIVENQNLDADETVRSSVLNAIKGSKNFQEAIEKLEKEKLIWYLIGPLRKDEDITEQINLKWEKDFQGFKQSINTTHEKLRSSLPNQNFLAYSTKDNDFNIRFESKKEPVKISDILRASSEGEVYHISLGRDNQITASKKNGNERHYDFTGSGSSEMIINWQAKDSEGNSIDSNIIIAVGSSGILEVIGEPKFGGLKFTSSLSEEEGDKILKLVEQNKEVFINGKSLLEAFIGMGKNVNNQPTLEEETFIRNPPESPQLPTPDSSGYFSPGTPSSRRSSFSVESEVGDKEFEITDEYIDDDYDKQAMHKDDERKYAQEGLEKDVDKIIDGIKAFGKEDEMLFQDLSKQLEDLQRAIFEKDQRIKEQDALIKSLTDENKGVNEVLEENIHLKRELERLKERNQEIEENDKYRLELVESEERVQELRTKLAKNEEANQNRLSEQDGEVGRLKQRTDELEQKLKDKGSEIADLKSQLKDQESEIQPTNRANEELQEKLKQSQAELRALQEENTKLKSDLEKIVEGLAEDDREEQLAEQLMEAKKENKTLTDEVNQLAEELNQLQKEKEDLEEAIQQPNIGGKSLADEMAEVNEKKDEEVRNLEEKIKRKDEEMQQIVKSNQRLERNLQDLDRKYREVSGKDKEHIAQLTHQLEQAKNELVNDELNKQIENLEEEKEKLLEQLRTKSTDSASFRKQQSEIDRLKQQLKERESVLTDTREELKSVKETLGQLQSLLEQKEVEAKVPETRNQDTQAVDKSSNKKISGLRQENKNLTRDKQTILAQLKPKIEEIVKLKENLKQLQEENKQLKQKATKNVGLDASSSTDQKETKEMEVQTDVKKDDFRDLYDKEGKYVRTELSDPSLTPAEVVEVEIRPQNIMDWPVPIPNDKPEKLIDPLKPTKVNTELSDPSLTSVDDPEKSRHKA